MTTELNDSYQSTPLTVGQGGSGVASNTAYSLLAAGTTATGAIQQAGTGTSNQVYVSGGSSALGTWTKGSTISTMQYISTQTASSSASLTFSSLSTTYFAYKIICDAIVPATNATALHALLNSHTSNYVYCNNGYSGNGSDTQNNSTSAAFIDIGRQMPNTASTANHFEILLVNPDTSIAYNGMTWIARYDDSTGSGMAFVYGMGAYSTSEAITSITFQMSSGNISTGNFYLYGILA